MVVKIERITKSAIVLPFSHGLYQGILNTGAKELEVKVVDPRDISHEQRRKAYALLHDIALWQGEPLEWVKSERKYRFIEETGEKWFSLSDCSVSTARAFISTLIHFCIHHDVPTGEPLPTFCMDENTLYQYVYWCVEHRKCAVTGRGNADLHHLDAVGMGNNRKRIHHGGRLAIPLCREMHTEVHALGDRAFLERYHLCGVRLDAYLCSLLGLRFESEQIDN